VDKLTLFLLGLLAFILTLIVFSTFNFVFVLTLGVAAVVLIARWAFIRKKGNSINHAKTEAGIILSAVSIIVTFLLWFFVEPLLLTWLPNQISTLAMNILTISPSIALSVVGFALYVRGRKAFWQAGRELGERVLLAIVGETMTIWSVWFGLGFYGVAAYLSTKGGLPYEPVNRFLVDSSPYYIMSLLWLVSGIVLLIDALKTSSFKYLARIQQDLAFTKKGHSKKFIYLTSEKLRRKGSI